MLSPTSKKLEKSFKYRLDWLHSFQLTVEGDKTLWDMLWTSILKTNIWKDIFLKGPNLSMTLIEQKHSSEAILLIAEIVEKNLQYIIPKKLHKFFFNYYNLQSSTKTYPELVIKMSFAYNTKALKEDNSLLYEALFQKYFVQNLLDRNITPHVVGFVSLFQMPFTALHLKNHKELENKILSKDIVFTKHVTDIRYDKSPPKKCKQAQPLSSCSWKMEGILQEIAWLDIYKEKRDKETGEYVLVKKKHHKRLYDPYNKIQGLVIEKSSGEQLEYWLRTPRSLHCWRTVIFQIIYSLQCFNDYSMRHNDLHNSNIFVEEGDDALYKYIVHCDGKMAKVASIHNQPMIKIFDFNFSAIDKYKEGCSFEHSEKLYSDFYKELDQLTNHSGIRINTSLDDRKFKHYYGTSHKRNPYYDIFCSFYYLYHQLYMQPWHTCKVLKEFLETCIHPGLLHFCFDSVKGWKGRLGIPKKYSNNLYKGFYSKNHRPIKDFMQNWTDGEILPEHLLSEPSLEDKDLWFIKPLDKMLELPFFDSFYERVPINNELWTDNTFCLPRYAQFRQNNVCISPPPKQPLASPQQPSTQLPEKSSPPHSTPSPTTQTTSPKTTSPKTPPIILNIRTI